MTWNEICTYLIPYPSFVSNYTPLVMFEPVLCTVLVLFLRILSLFGPLRGCLGQKLNMYGIIARIGCALGLWLGDFFRFRGVRCNRSFGVTIGGLSFAIGFR